MALHLDLLYSTLDSAVNARRTLDVIDVSSAISGVSKSDCALATNIAKHLGNRHGSLVLASLFLICNPDGAAEAVKGRLELHSPQNHPPSPQSDLSLHALHLIRVRGDFTRASGIHHLASALSDVPSVLLLRAFTKDQLIALRDLIGFASISGIADDPHACVSSVADAMKTLPPDEEHDHC
jgi:hypothetical protein